MVERKSITNDFGEKIYENTFVYANLYDPETGKEWQEIVWVEEIAHEYLVEGRNITREDDLLTPYFNMEIFHTLPENHVLNTTPYEWLREVMLSKNYREIRIENVTHLGEL